MSQYRDVADTIRSRINDGTYQRGGLLPNEAELASELGVNRATVNRALRILQAEGLVRVHRGKGTYVHEVPPIPRYAATRHLRGQRERSGGALATELADLGLSSRHDLDVRRDRPPPRVAEVLGLTPDEVSVVVRERHMYADDIPIQIATSYIPLKIAGGTPIEERDTGTGGLSSRLVDLGYPQAYITERVTARPPAPEEAKFLRMTEDQRVYDILHIGRMEDDTPVKVTLYVMPVHQWELIYQHSVD